MYGYEYEWGSIWWPFGLQELCYKCNFIYLVCLIISVYLCFIWENKNMRKRADITFLIIGFLIQLWATAFRFDGETSRIEERRKPAVPSHVHDDPHEDGIYLLIIINIISHNIKRNIHVSSQLSYVLCSEAAWPLLFGTWLLNCQIYTV